MQEVYKISCQANNFTSLASVVSLQTNASWWEQFYNIVPVVF